TVDNTNNLAIDGGDLTVTGATTLTNGRIVTGSNYFWIGNAGTVTRTNSYVDGGLVKVFSATGSKLFEVGTANGYSPVTVNATAGTFGAGFMVRAIEGKAPYVSGTNGLGRY